MATRQHLTVWIPVGLAALVTVGYVEWRTSQAAELAPTKERVGPARPDANARGSNPDPHALALAAAANARAERAERVVSEMKEHLARQGAVDAADHSSAATPEEDRERQRAEQAAFLEELDDRLATEPVDPAFRSEKVTAISTTATVLRDQGITLEKAECASSICKIRFSHPEHNRLPRAAAVQFLKAVHAPGSVLTKLAFNFKYEDGATVLYGTTEPSGEETETH
jgi:hypothetical protein